MPTLASLREQVAGPARPTIALLFDYMTIRDGGYQTQVFGAFHEIARKLDLNLFAVFGRGLEEPGPQSRAHNAIFDLVGPDSVDAVVLVSSVLAAHCGSAGVSRLLQKYADLPAVSLGLAILEVPSVVVDNSAAMQAVVEHLVVHHGCRRLAFLAGTPNSPESQLRLEAYSAVLRRHGIAVDPSLIGYGNFLSGPAHAALTELLERVGEIEAVVAANDSMALAAVDALGGRGLKVPGDVLVTGFDNVKQARLGDPPITTVAQPFEAMAEQTLLLILRQLTGCAVPKLTEVRADLLVRLSCGCTPSTCQRTQAAPQRQQLSSVELGYPAGAEEYLRQNEERVRALLGTELRVTHAEAPAVAVRLLNALRLEFSGRSGAFLSALDDSLNECRGDYDHHQALHNVITALRREFREVSGPGLEDIWFGAVSRIACKTTTIQAQNQIDADNWHVRLLSISDRLSTALDVGALENATVSSLQDAGITTGFISRFTDGNTAELEPFACVLDGLVRQVPRHKFPSRELLPRGGYPAERRYTALVFPLVFEAELLGVCVFDYAKGNNVYSLLRDQIAGSLGSITLHQEVLAKTMLHERSVQERQATARRLEALSMLSGGVAHDLNNTLGPLLALPDVIIRELSRLDDTAQNTEVRKDLFADVQSIKSAGQRAAQTIKDLLTLGRQGRATKEPLDLNRIVATAVNDGARVVAEQHGGIEILAELDPEPLVIRASEAHVSRAIMNLLQNAIEAIADRGQVALKTFRTTVLEATTGYETVAPGDYAVLSVSDSGQGVPADALERIFEPFYSRKRVGERSGSGLGLAIVHGVVKEHEGFVDLSSTEGRGTTFTLYFPSSREKLKRKSFRPGFKKGQARILVVDDDAVQGRTARRVLSHFGYQVDVFESGLRALESLVHASVSGEMAYDLVLLDMMLNEERNGLELLEEIRRLYPGQRALIASGQAPSPHAESEVAQGLAWLSKPYSAEALSDAVHAALASTTAEGVAS